MLVVFGEWRSTDYSALIYGIGDRYIPRRGATGPRQARPGSLTIRAAIYPLALSVDKLITICGLINSNVLSMITEGDHGPTSSPD